MVLSYTKNIENSKEEKKGRAKIKDRLKSLEWKWR